MFYGLFSENNKIIFKPKRGLKIELNLPKLRKNYKEKLYKLELLMEQKECPVTISLDNKFIYISFEIKKEIIHKTEGNYAGIDLNPNYIGLTLFNKNKKLIKSYCFNLTKLTKKSGQSSASNKSKYLENKLNFETIEISKKISKLCLENKIDFLFLEDLNFNGSKKLNKNFNHLCKNKWKRNLFCNNLKKRLDILGIKWFDINPAYSSFIGNLTNIYPDPISASIEIARRGYECIILKTKQFYPKLHFSLVTSRWKDLLLNNEFESWKDLFCFIKNSKMKYRVSWSIDHVFRKFYNNKSNISYICL